MLRGALQYLRGFCFYSLSPKRLFGGEGWGEGGGSDGSRKKPSAIANRCRSVALASPAQCTTRREVSPPAPDGGLHSRFRLSGAPLGHRTRWQPAFRSGRL